MSKRIWYALCGSIVSVIVLMAAAASSTGAMNVNAAPNAACGPDGCKAYLPIMAKPVAGVAPKFEVTQGLQQPDNSVRLIAGRTTYVRWTLTAPTAVNGVSAYLFASRNGVALAGSPLAAINNARTVGTSANRAALNDTFNFRLPSDWTTGNVSLSANAGNASGFNTSTTAQNFQFTATPNMAVKVVPIAYHCISGGSGTTTPAAPYNYLIDYTLRTYPVPGITLSTHAPVTYNGPCNGSGVPTPASTDWYNGSNRSMLDTVTKLWESEGRPKIYYYGLVHLDCGGGCIAGVGWIGGSRVAVGFDGFGGAHSGASDTHAHELGHNHGLNHAPGCGAGGATSFPYLDGSGRAMIGSAAEPNFGFDLNSLAIYPYSNYFDIMNYCDPQWVSDFTYEAWWKYDNTLLATQNVVVSDRSLLISGAIDPLTDNATFSPVYAVDTPARSIEPGDYVLELFDASGKPLARYPFAPISAQPDRTDGGPTEEITGFHLAVPYVEGVASVEIKHGASILGTLHAKSAAPLVSAPTNRSGQLSWSGRELDGEPLHYLVRASTDDGVTWETLGVDLVEPGLVLDPAIFGGQTVRVEIIASDGLNSTKLTMEPVLVPAR